MNCFQIYEQNKIFQIAKHENLKRNKSNNSRKEQENTSNDKIDFNINEFPELKGSFRAGIGRDNVPEKEAFENQINFVIEDLTKDFKYYIPNLKHKEEILSKLNEEISKLDKKTPSNITIDKKNKTS